MLYATCRPAAAACNRCQSPTCTWCVPTCRTRCAGRARRTRSGRQTAATEHRCELPLCMRLLCVRSRTLRRRRNRAPRPLQVCCGSAGCCGTGQCVLASEVGLTAPYCCLGPPCPGDPNVDNCCLNADDRCINATASGGVRRAAARTTAAAWGAVARPASPAIETPLPAHACCHAFADTAVLRPVQSVWHQCLLLILPAVLRHDVHQPHHAHLLCWRQLRCRHADVLWWRVLQHGRRVQPAGVCQQQHVLRLQPGMPHRVLRHWHALPVIEVLPQQPSQSAVSGSFWACMFMPCVPPTCTLSAAQAS